MKLLCSILLALVFVPSAGAEIVKVTLRVDGLC